MRTVTILLMAVGLSLFAYGVLQYIGAEQKQNESLAEARELVAGGRDFPEPEPTDENATPAPIVFSPQTGETIGTLAIAAIDAELAIIEGTSEEDLEKGVGHYAGTAFPNQGDQIVLSGHRDTVFRRMGELEIGDELVVNMAYGSFRYQIVETKIVDANDRTVIQPTAPDEVLTVSTCYPFSYIGNAPDRYIITAVPLVID